jgi:hypothetical protein
MPNPPHRPWTADDVAKLKKLAQRHPLAAIAAQLGRSPSATAVKAHQLKLSLRMQADGDQAQTGGPAGRL